MNSFILMVALLIWIGSGPSKRKNTAPQSFKKVGLQFHFKMIFRLCFWFQGQATTLMKSTCKTRLRTASLTTTTRYASDPEGNRELTSLLHTSSDALGGILTSVRWLTTFTKSIVRLDQAQKESCLQWASQLAATYSLRWLVKKRTTASYQLHSVASHHWYTHRLLSILRLTG